MPKVTYIHPDGGRDVLDVPVGTSIMQAAIANCIDGIVAECGGSMMCATCHVYVDPGQLDRLPPMSSIESDMLDQTACERRPNSRLSCQLVATPEFEGLQVQLPDAQI
jgi:2Fe-2S ferredoxin